MPPNPKTGKTDRRAKTEAELLEFHLNQVKLRAEVKRGKQRASDSPDSGEQEGSGLSPSPLVGIGMLTLSSGGSSAAHTPAEIPTTLPQPPLPDRQALAPTSNPITRSTPKHLAGKTPSRPSTAAAADEVPSTSELFETAPPSQQASRLSPHDYASLARAVKANADEIRRLSMRISEWESWAEKVDSRLKDEEFP